jgi:hypothetical protein
MNSKLCLTFFLFIVLVGVDNVLVDVTVGVKTGDWIEYQVAYTGAPTEGHDVTWARMEITDVQGKSLSVEIAVKYWNGTREEMTNILNLETGQLGDDFIIPADLNKGDTLFDKNVGNITISKIEEKTYAGVTRTVAYAFTSETTYFWDKATGILVEGNSKFPEYTMSTIVNRTNIWQPQLLGLDHVVFYTLVIGIAVLITISLALIVRRRK